MATIFLSPNETYTNANANNIVFGAGGGSETVILLGNPPGTTFDGNIEIIKVSGSASGTTFRVNDLGRLELVSEGVVYASFFGGLNSPIDVQFADGNIVLEQRGADFFRISNPDIESDFVRVDNNSPQSGDAVGLGPDQSNIGGSTMQNNPPQLSDGLTPPFNAPANTPFVVTSEQLLANYEDLDGDVLTVSNVRIDEGASLIDNGDGTFLVTPFENFTGDLLFRFDVSDGKDTISGSSFVATIVAAQRLTSALDTISGTEFDEAYQAVVSPFPGDNTLNIGDRIDGGAGSDVLAIELRQNFSGFVADGFLRNVETVRLNTFDEVERIFNASGVQGVDTYILSGNVEIEEIGSSNIDVELQDRSTGNTRIGFAQNVVSGENDSINLGLQNIGQVAALGLSQQIVGVDIADVEILNLTSNGVNVAAIDTQDVKQITTNGVGSLKLTGVGTGLKTFDGTLASGDIDVDLKQASAMTSIQTGTGDDIIRTSKSALDVVALVDGGSGNDVLELSGPIGIAEFSIENIETIALVGPDSSATFSSLAASDVERVIVGSTNAAGEYDFVNLGERTLAVTSLGDAAGTLITDNAGELRIDVEASLNGAGVSDLAILALESDRVDILVADGARYSGELIADVAEAVILSGSGVGVDGDPSKLVATNALAVAIDLSEDSFLLLDAGPLDTLSIQGGADLSFDQASSITASDVTILANGELGGITAQGPDISGVQTLSLSGVGQVQLGTITGSEINFDASGLRDLGSNKALNVSGIEGAALDINVSNVLGATNFESISGQSISFQGSALRENSVMNAQIGSTAAGGTATFVGGIQEDTFGIEFVNVAPIAESFQASVSITGGRRADTYTFSFQDNTNRFAIVTIEDFNQEPNDPEADKIMGEGLEFLTFDAGGFNLGGLFPGGGETDLSARQQAAAELLIDAGVTPSAVADDITFVDSARNTFFIFGDDLYGLAGSGGNADETLDDGEILFQFVGLSSSEGIAFA